MTISLLPAVDLRPYQEDAVSAMEEALRAREHPLCVLPTGSGKSLVIAELVARYRAPTLVLAHVKELLEQNSVALRKIAPTISQGFYSAGLKQKRSSAQVVFGSVQTVYRSCRALGPRSLIIIDEAHLTPRKADAMYAQVFQHFSLALRAGFTATPYRLDSGSLVDGADAWFDHIAVEVPAKVLVKQRYLCPLSGVLTVHEANLKGVATRAGDFVAEQAEKAVKDTLRMHDVVSDVLRLAAQRKNWLLFAPGVKHAQEICAALQQAGIEAALVTGETPDAERDTLVKRFREGSLRALVNVAVFTTGFDAPQTDCIISMRPTKSRVLWQQMLGRGMRKVHGKLDCLLLDFVGNLERLGGVGCVGKVIKESSGLERPRREQQTERNYATEDPEHEYQNVSLGDPMKMGGRVYDCAVTGMKYSIVPSKKFPGKNMLLALYYLYCEEEKQKISARSFLSVEYPGAARYHALQWFRRRGVQGFPPTAEAALVQARALPEPARVTVYWEPRFHCFLVGSETMPENMPIA